jgi:hypothetical protein
MSGEEPENGEDADDESPPRTEEEGTEDAPIDEEWEGHS